MFTLPVRRPTSLTTTSFSHYLISFFQASIRPNGRVQIASRGHGVTTRGILGIAVVFYCFHAMPEQKAAAKVGNSGNARAMCHRTRLLTRSRQHIATPAAAFIVHTPQLRLGCHDSDISTVTFVTFLTFLDMVLLHHKHHYARH